AYGVELDPRAAAHARAYGVKTRTRADLVADSFDFVNTEQVLEHLADPLETLADLRVGLRPDGLLKVSVPEGRGIEQRLRKPDWTAAKGSRSSLNAVAPLEHLNCFDRGSLVAV